MLCASAVADGVQSQLLSDIHVALLRLLQMDLEDAHATGAIQASFSLAIPIHSAHIFAPTAG